MPNHPGRHGGIRKYIIGLGHSNYRWEPAASSRGRGYPSIGHVLLTIRY